MADFKASKIPRKVFEPKKTCDNDMPNKDNPGPGAYDYSNVQTKKSFNA